jgi:hypothetical protein
MTRKMILSQARTRRTDGAEDDVGGIAGATFEIAAAEMTLCFHMSDHGLDGGAPRELAFDAAEDPAFLA